MNGPRSRSHGNTLERWSDHNSNRHNSSHRHNSTVSKMQHTFWVTKQTVYRKLGKKEDECIVACDAELDAKIELFRSIKKSCEQLQTILEEYQKKSNSLACEENSMGRFLKESSKLDEKTEAGKMMAVVGATLATTGKQRLAFQNPLRALWEKVESFGSHAIADTAKTIQEMEKIRTEYRAGLNWLKDLGQPDPENHRDMEKYRKVQELVKQSRAEFECQKLDCLQKVDLLAAARCNMFSRELIQYENTLKTFATECVKMFNDISASFPSHPQYKFTDVKELAEDEKTEKLEKDDNDDKLLSLDEPETKAAENKVGVQTEKGQGERSKTEGNDSSEGVLLADLLTDALPDNQLLPSQLLAQLSSEASFSLSQFPPPAAPSQQPLLKSSLTNNTQPKIPPRNLEQTSNKPWLDLFAELDPLSDPDAIDKKTAMQDRNC